MKPLAITATLLILGAGCVDETPDTAPTKTEEPAPATEATDAGEPTLPEEDGVTIDPVPTTTTTAPATTTTTEPETNFGYTANTDWKSAVAMSQTLDLRDIANHLDTDDATALDAIDRRGVYICRDVHKDQTPSGLLDAMIAAEYDLGLDLSTTAPEMASLAITHICPDLAFVAHELNAVLEEIYPAESTEDPDQQDASTPQTTAASATPTPATTTPAPATTTPAPATTTPAPATTTPAPPESDSGSETSQQAEAREKAASYLNYSGFSRSGLIDQLEYEGFTTAEATYGVDAQNADWNYQATRKAASYLDYSGFSRTGLIDQLEYEGFTTAEATYGVDSVGL